MRTQKLRIMLLSKTSNITPSSINRRIRKLKEQPSDEILIDVQSLGIEMQSLESNCESARAIG